MTRFHRPARNNGPLLFAGGFLFLLTISILVGKLPLAILGLYLVVSAITFLAYAADKSAARQQRWRTRESTLHLFALVGGWPGALAAQGLLRHKSKKTSFQAIFWLTVALNCGGLGWLFSPPGASILHEENFAYMNI